MTKIIDGKLLALNERTALVAEIKKLKLKQPPHLAIVLVGTHEPSQIYVRNKQKAAAAVGIKTTLHQEPATISQTALLARLAQLSIDPSVNGILVQLPLPAHLDQNTVITAIDPKKDVDGLTPTSQGLLAIGKPRFVPCTPLGCLELIKSVRHDLSGADALVIGRSPLVGAPMARLLIRENATVTVAHSHTADLAAHTRRADIIVAAVGKPGLVTENMVKPGAIIIDVGINRVDGKLVGDVDFDAVKPVASAITPVPGGVGPMTITCLLKNTVYAARYQSGLV